MGDDALTLHQSKHINTDDINSITKMWAVAHIEPGSFMTILK